MEQATKAMITETILAVRQRIAPDLALIEKLENILKAEKTQTNIKNNGLIYYVRNFEDQTDFGPYDLSYIENANYEGRIFWHKGDRVVVVNSENGLAIKGLGSEEDFLSYYETAMRAATWK